MSDSLKLLGGRGFPESSIRPLEGEVSRARQAKNRLHDARIAARLTKAVKWVCIATLLVTAALPLYIAPYQTALRFIVAASAATVMFQALQAHRYAFAVLFAATGLLYNPVIPTFSLAGDWQVLVIYVTLILFALSLTWMKGASRALAAFPNKG